MSHLDGWRNPAVFSFAYGFFFCRPAYCEVARYKILPTSPKRVLQTIYNIWREVENENGIKRINIRTMNIKMWAKVFGAVLTVVGVLGFVSGVTTDGLLLGIFEVDGRHNVIHLASGILALLAGFKTEALSRLFFKVFGVVYALVTVLGFVQGNTVLGFIGVNMADNLLHLVIAAFSLWLGFFSKPKSNGMGGMNMPM